MDYANHMYLPALDNARKLSAADHAVAKNVAAYLERAGSFWDQIHVRDVRTAGSDTTLRVGETLTIECVVDLGQLRPEDIAVELYHGPISTRDTISQAERTRMESHKQDGESYVYTIDVRCTKAGRQGFAVRILPSHPDLAHPFVPGLIRWG
jgi:starch phosphorylase